MPILVEIGKFLLLICLKNVCFLCNRERNSERITSKFGEKMDHGAAQTPIIFGRDCFRIGADLVRFQVTSADGRLWGVV